MINLSTPDWNIESIDTVLFDKDGTLIDSHIYWGRIIELRSQALIDLLELDKSNFPQLCECMGYSIKTKKLLEKGPIALVSREKVIEILVYWFAAQRVFVTAGQISDLFIKVHKEFMKEIHDYSKILPGVEGLLRQLKGKGVKIAVVTTDSIHNTEEIMSFLQIDKYFDLLLGKEATPLPKVSGQPAIIALEKLKSDAGNTVAIGDSVMDITMAKRANLRAAIAVALGQVSLEELGKATPYTLHSYKELLIS